MQGCADQTSTEAFQSYLPWLRNVCRNFLHVGNRFSLTGCACCAKMPASSSEIFTKAGSCRNKLNRTTSNFTTEMKTACGVIKNQASNRQKKCGYCLPRARKPFWKISLFFPSHFNFHSSKWFGPKILPLIVPLVSKRQPSAWASGKPSFRPTAAWPMACPRTLCLLTLGLSFSLCKRQGSLPSPSGSSDWNFFFIKNFLLKYSWFITC